MNHYRDCVRSILLQTASYECQVSRHQSNVHSALVLAMHQGFSCALGASPHANRAYTFEMRWLQSMCWLQEGDGDFMLVFPTSIEAAIFCLKVAPGSSCQCAHHIARLHSVSASPPGACIGTLHPPA